MTDNTINSQPSPIPDKRYHTIKEASGLCNVKPHVLRYWEEEFKQLNPVKRCGGRRYYQQKDILLIQQIKDLLYTKGFTIAGAKKQLRINKPAVEITASSKKIIPDNTHPTVSQKHVLQLIAELKNLLEKLK